MVFTINIALNLKGLFKKLWPGGESDKAKMEKKKRLYSLVQVLLPVWESLGKLGPGLRRGKNAGRKAKGLDKKKKKRGHRDIDKDVVAAGNVILFFFFSQTWWLMNHRFSQTRGMRVGMVSVAFSIRKSWKYKLNFVSSASAHYSFIHFFDNLVYQQGTADKHKSF